MGNTNYESKNLRIYIETEKQFYNSGSSIEGVVLVEARDNFRFDALYLRIEGTLIMIKVVNSASGSRVVLPIATNSQAAMTSILWNIFLKNMKISI